MNDLGVNYTFKTLYYNWLTSLHVKWETKFSLFSEYWKDVYVQTWVVVCYCAHGCHINILWISDWSDVAWVGKLCIKVCLHRHSYKGSVYLVFSHFLKRQGNPVFHELLKWHVVCFCQLGICKIFVFECAWVAQNVIFMVMLSEAGLLSPSYVKQHNAHALRWYAWFGIAMFVILLQCHCNSSSACHIIWLETGFGKPSVGSWENVVLFWVKRRFVDELKEKTESGFKASNGLRNSRAAQSHFISAAREQRSPAIQICGKKRRTPAQNRHLHQP